MKVLDHVDEIVKKEIPATFLDTRKGLTFTLICKYQSFIKKFFLEMVSDTPNIKFPPAHISLKPFKDLLIAEIQFEKSEPYLIDYFEKIKYEIKAGACSAYYASRIVEMRAFSIDTKRRLIQERILDMTKRFPSYFEYDLFITMQKFFCLFQEEYFRFREVKQVANTIMSLYSICRRMIIAVEGTFRQRFVCLSLSTKRLHFPLGTKKCLSVCIGINVLKQNEVFKKTHLIEAIRSFHPEIELIKDCEFEQCNEGIHLINIEVVKENGFTLDEIKALQVWLPRTIKGKIEHLQRTIFMPRNEEEILRHIITLGKELHFARDLPQLILSFEKQTESTLVFNVILARVLLPDTRPIEDLLKVKKLRPKIDRIKQIGKVRKKYPKEAAVCKVELSLENFLREDHSVDLYQARQKILQELENIFGNLRDYNGGMISKQNETYLLLQKSLGLLAKKHSYLLKNFFHSLLPIEKRSFIDFRKIKTLFLILLEIIESPKKSLTKKIDRVEYTISKNSMRKKILNPVISLEIEYDDCRYFGYIENIGDHLI